MSSSRESRERNETAGREVAVPHTGREVSKRHLDNEDRDRRSPRSARICSLSTQRSSRSRSKCKRSRISRCVVLAHGAGVSNLVHRIGRPTGVVELFPRTATIARPRTPRGSVERLGSRIGAIVGTFMTPQGSFTRRRAGGRSGSARSSLRWGCSRNGPGGLHGRLFHDEEDRRRDADAEICGLRGRTAEGETVSPKGCFDASPSPLDVVVEVELPRVRAEAHGVDLVLALVGDPRLDHVGREHATREQVLVVGFDRVEHLVE